MPTTEEVLEKLRSAQHHSEHAPNVKDLAAWRTELENSARGWEAISRQFKVRADDLREKIKAVDILIGQRPSTPAQNPSIVPPAAAPVSDDSESAFTPVHAYWPAILESLVEFGGRAQREKVVERVGEKLESHLTLADRQLLPSGLDVRWKNRVAWQRLNMVNQGLLKRNSPRGVWEITDDGRKWLGTTNNAMSALQLHVRLAGLCQKSAPNCEAKIAPSSVPDHFRLKVTDGDVVILSPDFDIPINQWSAKSEEELWDLLESISNRRIRRPV